MKIAIVGSGGLGRAVLDTLVRSEADLDVRFVDDFLHGSHVNGVFVVGDTRLLARRGFLEQHKIIIAIGDCKSRGEIFSQVKDNGGYLGLVIDPSAKVSEADTIIGEGTMIMPFAIIGPNVRIGDYCIINNRATVAHDSRIGNGVNICDGVSIRAEVGDEAFIGLHACCVPGIKIGARAIVGAGAVLTKDVPPDTTVAGVPARIIAHRGTHG